MPCAVTAFSLKIASPGDAAIELSIVREVVGDWNARNALEQKRILLPLPREEAKSSSPADLLVAFFCSTPATSGDVEIKIEKQLQSARPALIYFSEGRADLIGAQAWPSPALDEFKKRFAAAPIDSYGDEKELRAKLARQLEATIGAHAHFQVALSASSAAPPPLSPPVARPLSTCAVTILSEACDDFEAYIGRIKAGDLLKIQANGKQLVEQNDPATVEKWESAFQELHSGGFIRDAGCNGQLFQISTKGFDFLKTIGKTPVGYIAELGGM